MEYFTGFVLVFPNFPGWMRILFIASCWCRLVFLEEKNTHTQVTMACQEQFSQIPIHRVTSFPGGDPG